MKRYRIVEFYDFFPLRKARNNTLRSAINGGGGWGVVSKSQFHV